jgi:hypothetical protein
MVVPQLKKRAAEPHEDAKAAQKAHRFIDDIADVEGGEDEEEEEEEGGHFINSDEDDDDDEESISTPSLPEVEESIQQMEVSDDRENAIEEGSGDEFYAEFDENVEVEVARYQAPPELQAIAAELQECFKDDLGHPGRESFLAWDEYVSEHRDNIPTLRDCVNLLYEILGGDDEVRVLKIYETKKDNPVEMHFLKDRLIKRYELLRVFMDVLPCSDSFEAENSDDKFSRTDINKLGAVRDRIHWGFEMAMSSYKVRSTISPRYDAGYSYDSTALYMMMSPNLYKLPPNEHVMYHIQNRIRVDKVKVVFRPGKDRRNERILCTPYLYNGIDTNHMIPFAANSSTPHLLCLEVEDDRAEAENRSTIADYYNSCMPPSHQNRELMALMRAPTIRSSAIDYFNGLKDQSILPLSIPDREMFSFRNGVYFTGEDRFQSYPVHSRTSSCNFLDYDFDFFPERRTSFFRGGIPTCTDAGMGEDDGTDWFDIPTPNFDRIFKSQIRNGDNVCNGHIVRDASTILRFNWAFLAHSFLYEVGKYDKWQKVYSVIGTGGTGKSLIMNILDKIYPPGKVRTTGDKHEHTFGLGALYGGYVWTIRDLGKNCSFPIGDLMSIATGEDTSICIKHEMAKTLKWKACGIIFCNSFFALIYYDDISS